MYAGPIADAISGCVSAVMILREFRSMDGR